MSYCCLVLGETGVGKSSFINAITKTNECEVGYKGNACTIIYNIINTKYNNNTFILIDTPGLNDAKGDIGNIKYIKKAVKDYPGFRCILILMKFQDQRLCNSMVKTLQNYMDCFPLKQFWEHVIIIRTHADTSYKYFDIQKQDIEGSIVKCIQHDDFTDFRNFMESKNISIPTYIKEFYVDCFNKADIETRFNANKVEFEKIFNAIKGTPKMFLEIKYEDKQEKDNSGNFPKVIIKRTLIYIDENNNKLYGEPYVDHEYELSNLKVINRIPDSRAGSVESHCRKKRVHMYYYETKVYEGNNGEEVMGSKCLVRDEWINK